MWADSHPNFVHDYDVEGAQKTVVDEIDLWTRDFGQPPVYWLNGLAGTGKTAIAYTVVTRMNKNKRQLSFLFCSRKFKQNFDLKCILPELARQLSYRCPIFEFIYLSTIASNPEIIYAPPGDQMKKLMVEPLTKSGTSAVIVIDALDKCDDEGAVSAMLTSIGEFSSMIPNVKFLITSRPRPHIRGGFRPLVESGRIKISTLHEVDPYQIKEDIRLHLERGFSGIRSSFGPPDGWPSKRDLRQLCERAEGLFAYAAAVLTFIGAGPLGVELRLSELLEQRENWWLKASKKSERSICTLYTSTLQEAFSDCKPDDYQTVRSVLGAVVLAARPISPSTIATLLGFDLEDVLLCLKSIEPLLILHEGNNGPVQPFHKSLGTFLTDPELCEDEKFHVSPPILHEDLLIGCLKLVNSGLKEKMGGFSGALKYARASWDIHLSGTTPTGKNVSKITEHLHPFLEHHLLSCKKARHPFGTAGDAADVLKKWSQVCLISLLSTKSVLTETRLIPPKLLSSLNGV